MGPLCVSTKMHRGTFTDHKGPTAHFAQAHKGPTVHHSLYLGKMGHGVLTGWHSVGQMLYLFFFNSIDILKKVNLLVFIKHNFHAHKNPMAHFAQTNTVPCTV